jgi:hypothetical protein
VATQPDATSRAGDVTGVLGAPLSAGRQRAETRLTHPPTEESYLLVLQGVAPFFGNLLDHLLDSGWAIVYICIIMFMYSSWRSPMLAAARANCASVGRPLDQAGEACAKLTNAPHLICGQLGLGDFRQVGARSAPARCAEAPGL